MSVAPAHDSIDAQFREEQAAAERFSNQVRLGAIVALAVLQFVLLYTSNEEPSVVAISLLVCGIAGAYGVGLAFWLRRGRFSLLISYLSIAHDVVAITALALASAAVVGGGEHYVESTKSSFSLLYFLVIATAALRQSRRIALFAGVASAIGYTSLLLAVWIRLLGASWRVTLPVAIISTLVIHLSFYKLLRVPLPWGVLEGWAF